MEPPPLMPADSEWMLTRKEASLILGAQANLWTEYVPDEGGRCNSTAYRPLSDPREHPTAMTFADYAFQLVLSPVHVYIKVGKFVSEPSSISELSTDFVGQDVAMCSRNDGCVTGGGCVDAVTAEYMLLPRMSATAEVLWSPPDHRDWDSFRGRLPHVLAHCEALGIRHRPLS